MAIIASTIIQSPEPHTIVVIKITVVGFFDFAAVEKGALVNTYKRTESDE